MLHKLKEIQISVLNLIVNIEGNQVTACTIISQRDTGRQIKH